MTVTNGIYTHSTSWRIRACPSGPGDLYLMLSKTDQDIRTSLPTKTEDRQQDETFTDTTHKHKQGVIPSPLT